MEWGAWQATVHGVAMNRTGLSDFTFFLSIVPFEEGNGNQFQCSCLENPMDRGAWWGCILWGCKELDRTRQLTYIHTHTHSLRFGKSSVQASDFLLAFVCVCVCVFRVECWERQRMTLCGVQSCVKTYLDLNSYSSNFESSEASK